MKTLIISICTLFTVLASSLGAAEPGPGDHHYEGKITGLYCSACAGKLKASLGRLAGVTRVKIAGTGEAGVQRLRVDSTSPELTKEAAIKALGEDAKTFTILSLEKVR